MMKPFMWLMVGLVFAATGCAASRPTVKTTTIITPTDTLTVTKGATGDTIRTDSQPSPSLLQRLAELAKADVTITPKGVAAAVDVRPAKRAAIKKADRAIRRHVERRQTYVPRLFQILPAKRGGQIEEHDVVLTPNERVAKFAVEPDGPWTKIWVTRGYDGPTIKDRIKGPRYEFEIGNDYDSTNRHFVLHVLYEDGSEETIDFWIESSGRLIRSRRR